MTSIAKYRNRDVPHPREAYGHPAASGVEFRMSDHQAGHDASAAPAAVASAAEQRAQNAIVPPHDTKNSPKTSLSGRIRRGINVKGMEK